MTATVIVVAIFGGWLLYIADQASRNYVARISRQIQERTTYH